MNLIIKHFPELSDLQVQQFKALQHLYRVWNLKKTANNEWGGTSDGVIGTAHGVVSGNALKWSYRYNLILEDSFLNKLSVDFDDWMFLVENDVLMNRAVFSKFGLKLGTVIITFKKSNG